MARFVDTAESQAALIRIIKNSESDLYIISPYTKISGQTKEYIKNIDKKSINFKIISRMESKSDTNVPDTDIQFLRELQNAKILVCQNLHAKCYLNEKEGLITSLNLHEHSQTSNWEMGISFSKDEDPEIYNGVIKEIRHLEERSIENPKVRKEIKKSNVEKTHEPVSAPKQPVHPWWYLPPITKIKKGFCIRCGREMIKFDPQRPLCVKCFPEWAKFQNPNYKEKFCHSCRKEISDGLISINSPLCPKCSDDVKL